MVLILIIGFTVADRYINGAMANYQTTAYAYTKSTADLIDGDKIAGYLETGEKDAYSSGNQHAGCGYHTVCNEIFHTVSWCFYQKQE